jgi:hypothetical protein
VGPAVAVAAVGGRGGGFGVSIIVNLEMMLVMRKKERTIKKLTYSPRDVNDVSWAILFLVVRRVIDYSTSSHR